MSSEVEACVLSCNQAFDNNRFKHLNCHVFKG